MTYPSTERNECPPHSEGGKEHQFIYCCCDIQALSREKAEVKSELLKMKNCPNDHCMNLHKEIARQKDMIAELFQKNSTAKEAELEAALSLATGALKHADKYAWLITSLDELYKSENIIRNIVSERPIAGLTQDALDTPRIIQEALLSPAIKAEVARLEEQARRVEELEKELAELRMSPAYHDPWLQRKLSAQSSLMEKMLEFTEHDKDCLCAQGKQGRPTKDGGYETLYGYGKQERWYQKGEQPECSCGLGELLTAYEELSKKGKV